MKTAEEINFKLLDVYTFRYNEEETKKRFEPYHCFDGTLVVRENREGSLYLADTYWGSSESRNFTPEQALSQGHLKFICNLNDVEEIKEHEKSYYDDSDIFHVHIHAGYRSKIYLRKGAIKSKDKMITSIKGKIEDAEYEAKSATERAECYRETLSKIESGDLTVYI